MRTAPGDVTILHANLTPIGILLNEQNLKSYARIATRPEQHPISPATKRTAKIQVKSHLTALHHMAKRAYFDPTKLEKINPVGSRPGAKPLITINIPTSKEEAIVQDNLLFKKGIMIYTDGSGYEGNIAAAAILYFNGYKQSELTYRLGPDTQHMVFEGELTAIILGIHLARKFKGRRQKITLNIDNQATILTMKYSRPQAAQHLIEEIKRYIKLLRIEEAIRASNDNRTNLEVEFKWVAGHMGSTGNDAVDKSAKTAATRGSSHPNYLPPTLRNELPISLSATKQLIDKLTKLNTKTWWRGSTRYKKMREIDPTLPSANFIKATNGLNHSQISVLTQLRTGHAPLNKHLHRINRSDNPNCSQCTNTPEDVEHFIFRCNKYTLQRHKLVTNIKRNAYSTRHLLSDPVTIRHTLNFVNATRRFTRIYGDISAELMDDNDRN